MEDSRERLVRLGQDETLEFPLTGNRDITTVDNVAIQSTQQDLPVAPVGGLCWLWYHDDYFSYLSLYRFRTFNKIRERLTRTEPHEEKLQEEECQRPQPALPKARPRRDPPPRVSRRSSQVSPPIYLRHRFQPRSRKDSSSRR
ncbi:unnamed protein product [Eruca vesicaria subsp. sativa]|uniref:Uncharacterized protein n=1 Tax=Eruca vesicaria subsp. sativa TaxID=29727 RepID=A0ABC8KU10_ERUVS|nr:unnamed protein product [Eruca vesicaria subsp. sativa]